MAPRHELQDAPTIADLCQRFREEHVSKRRPGTQAEYAAAIDQVLLADWSKWKHKKVAEITFADVAEIHRKITENGIPTGRRSAAPYRANRTVAALSKMFSLAIRWGWRTDSPTKGLKRNPEEIRRRHLRDAELDALS
jgi:site-specific recombinase XerD